jgi:hypothetical protein
VKGFKKYCISTALDETDDDDDDMCGMTVKMLGIFGVSVREKTLTVKMETVTLIGKGGLNLTWCVYYVY